MLLATIPIVWLAVGMVAVFFGMFLSSVSSRQLREGRKWPQQGKDTQQGDAEDAL